MNGFCPALLVNINDVAEGNAPGKKLQIAGFLASLFCAQNSSVSPVNSQFQNGHYRPLTVKYTKRPLLSDVTTTDDCSIDSIPGYSEWTIPNLAFKKHTFYVPDDTIQQYCIDASATQSVGKPPTTVMKEIYDRILESCNIVMKAINVDLVTQMATQFGVNVTTGESNGKIINVNSDGNKMILDNGIVDMLRDIQENEICGDPYLVGGGLWSAWNHAQLIACCSAAGLDYSKIGLPKFFFDKDTQNIWGTNTAALIAPGAVKLITRNNYIDGFTGQRGNSFFTSFPMPVEEFGCNLDDCLGDLVFDMQLKYIDCPTTIAVGGVNQTVDRGWMVIISKRYGLWVQPPNAYSPGDELYDTNGTLKYYLTNDGAETLPYAYGYGH